MEHRFEAVPLTTAVVFGAEMTNSHPVTSRKRQQTRERLMDAAYELFAEEGVHATSIEAIAEAADFTRGAFYSNFESKNELLFALADREWSIRLEIVRTVIEGFTDFEASGPLEQQVSALLVRIFTALPDDRRWALISREFELLALRDPDIAPQHLAHKQEFQTQLADVLMSAAHTFGVEFTLAPGDVTTFLTLMHEHAIQAAMLSHTDDVQGATRDEMLRILPTLVSHFTRTSPGA